MSFEREKEIGQTVEGPVNLATILENSGFEEDFAHSQWTTTKPNKNYGTQALVYWRKKHVRHNP